MIAETEPNSPVPFHLDWSSDEETIGDLSQKIGDLEMQIHSLESKIDELKFHAEEETEKWFRTITFQINDSMKTVLWACLVLGGMVAYLIWKLVHA